MNLYHKITLYGFGGVFLLFGLLVSGFWKHFYDHIVAQRIILSNRSDSQTYETWSSNNVPVYFRIRVFNLTNPSAALKKLEKPHFEEAGPYVYKFSAIKKDITWNSNDTISYVGSREWIFVPELSNGTESDYVTQLNPVPVVIADKVRFLNKALRIIVNGFLKLKEDKIIIKTIKELLFDGFEDNLLIITSKLKKIIPQLKSLPDRFGWYYGKNGTENDAYSFFTGGSDVNKLGLLYSWNYTSQSPAFRGECGKVGGSVGDLWPLNAAKQDNVSLYISDFCSAMSFHYVGPHSVKDIDGIKFEGNELTFDNGTKNSRNRCYCPTDQCNIKSGVRSMANCVGAPISVSFPHFYAADSSYREAMTGMRPDEQKHKFHIILQKDSGIMLDVAARLQLNLLVEHIDGIDFLDDLPTGYMPAFWFEESADLPAVVTDQLKFAFNVVPFWLAVGGLLLVILGSALLVTGFILTRLSYQPIPYRIENI